MKIERISENQIRCTLTREDLAAREIRISELAYGSDKMKLLFQDMMQQASRDCGFEINNMPLMIEAIPVSMDAIVLIITRVEDPEELDSRFSRFSPEENAPSEALRSAAASLTGVDDVLDLITRITQARKEAAAQKAKEDSASPAPLQAPEEENDEIYHLSRFYLFRDMDRLIRAAHALDPAYTGMSTLYKNPEDGNYYLILRKADTPPDLFNKVCNVLSEYGLQVEYISGIDELFGEHMDAILPENALGTLRQI